MSNAGDKGAYFVYTGQAREDIPQDVICVRVYPSIRRIEDYAFHKCSLLTIVDLGEGLEEIGKRAFGGCTSLREIVIPPVIRRIEDLAFLYCSGLRIVIPGKGLEEIGWRAFMQCTLLREIVIPPDISVIHEEAFYGCLQLTNARFCDEIEELVSGELMRD
jgi:hypothetical protein